MTGTYAEKFAKNRVVWFAGPALDIFEILGQPEANNLEHAVQWLV